MKIFQCNDMIKVTQIASYIAERYLKEFGEKIDEIKLQKLLYFTQREHLIRVGSPLFEEGFRAWKFGPVLLSVHDAYKQDSLHESLSEEDKKKLAPVFDYVFTEFAPSKTTTLVTLTHGETSWKKARVGFGKYESSDVPMSMDDIRHDAQAAAKLRQEKQTLRKLQTYLDQHKSQFSHIYLF